MPSLYEFYQEKEIRELTNAINSAKYISEEQKEAMVAELSVVSEASKKSDFLWLDSAGLYFNQVTAAFYTASTFDYEEGPRGWGIGASRWPNGQFRSCITYDYFFKQRR